MAGEGIGRATALILARAGAAVAVAARTETEIAAVADEIREAGGQAMAVPTDVASWAAVQHLVDEVARAWGPADIVVANAGIVKPAEDTWHVAPEAWAQNVDVNLTGAFYTARAFLPAMLERGDGRGDLRLQRGGDASGARLERLLRGQGWPGSFRPQRRERD